MDTLGRKIQIYRGLESSLPILDEGELAYTYDENGGNKKLWVGSSDGINHRIQAEQYIIDDLVSNVADGALSARQGKILKDMIDAIGAGGASVNVVDNLLSSSPISALSARMGKVLNEKIVNHENNTNTQKHIELVDTEPVDLTNTGVVFLRRDESVTEVPNQPTFQEHINKIASTTELGHVKVDGTSIKVDETGIIKAEIPVIQDATATQKGIVQLNDTLTSSSTTEAATANAIKQVNDKFILESSITPSGQNGWDLSNSRYFKDGFGIVHFVLNANAGTKSTFTRITALPSGYRPTRVHSIPVILVDSSGNITGEYYVQVNTDGSIIITSMISSNSSSIFGNFSYKTTE